MKYIITESQHKFLIEQEIPIWFKRRFNAANMEKHITNGEINYPTLCDDFGDEFEYADNVISYAVNQFMTIDEDIFEDERYDEWEEMLIEMCKEKFGERLFEAYRTTCQDEDEMMFESKIKKHIDKKSQIKEHLIPGEDYGIDEQIDYLENHKKSLFLYSNVSRSLKLVNNIIHNLKQIRNSQ
jgi:hypothetical protein